jgi:hypothetical protein
MKADTKSFSDVGIILAVKKRGKPTVFQMGKKIKRFVFVTHNSCYSPENLHRR